jgi:hypothetical protein
MVFTNSFIIISLILLVILCLGLFLIKISHFGKKVKLFIFVILILLLYFSLTNTISENNIKLNSFEGYTNIVSLYLGAIIDSFKSAFTIGSESVQFVGNVIKGNLTTGK